MCCTIIVYYSYDSYEHHHNTIILDVFLLSDLEKDHPPPPKKKKKKKIRVAAWVLGAPKLQKDYGILFGDSLRAPAARHRLVPWFHSSNFRDT